MANSIRRTAIVLVGLVGCIAGSAYAHTALSGSVPTDQAVLEVAPNDIQLKFSAPVRLTAISLQTTEGTEPLRHSTRNVNQEFIVALPALSPGVYVIAWRAVAEDTHVMSGEIQFTISS